jgi:penicillin-binding protein 2
MRLRRKNKYQAIEPDEILIDAKNLPGYDAVRLEGKIEKAIEPKAFRDFVVLAGLIGFVFLGQLVWLQVVQASTLSARAERNRLEEHLIIAERGIVTDRAGIGVVENKNNPDFGYATRVYPLGETAAHLVGYVSYPKKDKNGYWTGTETKGLSGIEAAYNVDLAGKNGVEIRETDASSVIVSGSTIREPLRGAALALSIDAGLQKELYDVIRTRATESGFAGGSGVIMDIETGEVYALASYPSFDPALVSGGGDGVSALLTDPRAPFLDRAISGLYAPGSVVKTIVAAAALEEGVITPDTQILSTGSISVPNQYDPEHPSVFKDWRAHGWVDMRHALAVSSDVYFYEVGGGFEDQRGLGIALLDQYFRAFGLGVATGIAVPGEEAGIIPTPSWKAETFGDRWLLGDTYHTAIGQYGFQVTTLELARAVSAIANGGTLVAPTLLKGERGARTSVGVQPEHLAVVREGMLLATKVGGTAAALDIAGLEVGGKTGTAQVGVKNEFVNSVVIGFFPYVSPRYAFAVVMERGKAGTQVGAPAVMASVLQWVVAHRSDMIH